MSHTTGRRGEASLHRTVRLRNHLASVKRSFSAMNGFSRSQPIAGFPPERLTLLNMLFHMNITDATEKSTIGAALGDILSIVGPLAFVQKIRISGHFHTEQRCHDWLKDFVEDRDDLVALVTKCHEERDYRGIISYMADIPDPTPSTPPRTQRGLKNLNAPIHKDNEAQKYLRRMKPSYSPSQVHPMVLSRAILHSLDFDSGGSDGL
ncbi:hypothetical protein BXZ70DRAFT_1007478 [Cristinia sonorae]|uniref:Uncharacterized protein n=1 Tax=Cristinia sonorae TaxID=1940300 RepID=A0A8K0UP91_9AGAR|nr:hypothetical protein BXZ70DRAFT_1007478 [Cristinia sonorae]